MCASECAIVSNVSKKQKVTLRMCVREAESEGVVPIRNNYSIHTADAEPSIYVVK